LARGGGGRATASARLRALPRSALLHLYRQCVFSPLTTPHCCANIITIVYWVHGETNARLDSSLW